MTDGDSSAARLQPIHRLQAPCLRDLVLRAAETPGAPAELSPGRAAVSFDVFVTRIASIAKMLRSCGVRRGDVVAVAMPDGPELLTALLGAVEAGAAAPFDCQLTLAEFRSRLTLLRPSVLLTAGNGHGGEVARSLGIPVVGLDSQGDNSVSFSPHASRLPEQCALLLQTSATTGEPKLVPLSHANLYAICSGVQHGLALQSDDRYLSLMPLHHILGYSCAVGQLMAGGSVACTGFEARNFLPWLEELRPTWYAAGPALHRAILEMAKADPEHFRRSSLRFVRCGSGAGSPTLLSDIESVLGVKVVNGYGLTEVGPVANTPPHLPRKTGSVGRAVGPEIAIMDARGNFLPAGSEGEIVLRGDAVMEGYLNAEEANREAFLNGWFRTGDLGRMDHEGDLFITGRIKEVINRGGETISPLEIDHALSEHPGIVGAASFAVPHPTLGDDIVAAVVLRPGARAVASEIRNFLAERLSRSRVPGRIWFVESIPLNPIGKPLRETLRTQFQTSAQAQELPDPSVPEDESKALLHHRVGVVWMQVLSTDMPGWQDNFFAMGGDSLSAARMFALLASELQIDEAPTDLAAFLDAPTFFHLVQVVAKRAHRDEIRFEDVSAVCLQALGDGPAVFFFPGEEMEPWTLRHLARCLGDQQPFFALRHRLIDPADFAGIAIRFASLVSQIRPAGPIVLAGHCYGGILAYDVAQRMLAMSRPGISLVLVDVDTPRYQRVRVNLPIALRAVARGQGRRLAAELARHFRFIRDKSRSVNRESAVAQSGVAETVPVPEVPVPASLSPGGIVLRTYAPRPYPGPLASALAAGSEVNQSILQNSKRGWRELARGPFQERSFLGSHHSIFNAENAPALASFILSAVQALTQPGTAVP
ncbi:MAG TPA: AMP-binding protein [Bryobacteraceae bacterium]|nr:AMP-binding protein [Bryobacteraceae bacterium]